MTHFCVICAQMLFPLFSLFEQCSLCVSYGQCGKGIKVIEYSDEFFKSKRNEQIHESVDLNGFKYSYDSLQAIGSYCPPVSGLYRFKIVGKTTSQLIFENGEPTNDLGLGGQCVSSGDEHETEEMNIFSNRCYSIEAKMRTGCGLYQQRFKIYVKRNNSEYEIAKDFIDCTYSQCLPNYSGANCQKACPKCPANAYCDEGLTGSGQCKCKQGWYGSNCTDQCSLNEHCGSNQHCENGQCVCNEDFFGSSCKTYCDRFGTCNGHGTCNSEGTCVCDGIYKGDKCDHKEGEEPPAIVDHLPNNCQEGLVITRYGDEIGSDQKERYISPSFSIASMQRKYDMIEATGSFCPPRSGRYRFRLDGKSYVKLTFNGKEVGGLGPAASCLPKLSEIEETEELELSLHRCYPISAQVRTGCGLYKQWVHLYVSENGGEWKIADNFITCSHSDCLPDYFGATCSGRCSINCSGHGHCSNGVLGTGMCICEDGYLNPNCEQKYIAPATKCGKGLKMTVFESENDFTGVKETKTLDSSSVLAIGNSFDSIKIEGSVIPPVHGDYQFKFYARPTGELKVNSEKVGTLGGSRICIQSSEVTGESSVQKLRTNTSYPIEIKMRTGCALITDKKMILQWKNGPKYSGISSAEWEDVPPEYLFDCPVHDCMPNLYGPRCDQQCKQCGENQYCSDGLEGSGKCLCMKGWYGANCTDKCAIDSHCGDHQTCLNGQCVCQSNYFGQKCDAFCSRNSTCNNHGTCDGDGKCFCDDQYSGEWCERFGGEIPPSYGGLPEECQSGIQITRYGNEFFGDTQEKWTSQSLNIPSMKRAHNSYEAVGSFCPNISGKYKFKLDGKSSVLLKFNGTEIGKIGTVGSCLPLQSEIEETDEMELYSSTCYPISAKLRTGCSIYKQWFNLYSSFNGSAYEIAHNFLTCQYSGCLPGYYGQFCENKCQSDCSNHGRCNDGIKGNGQCICDDGYALPTCRYKEQLDQPRCKQGVKVSVYDDEIGFTGKNEEYHISTLNTNPDHSFDAFIFEGSILPPQTGDYQLRFFSKPTGQLSFSGETKPTSLGPSGSCLDSLNTLEETSIFSLRKDTVYPFKLSMRTGCTLYNKETHVQWKNGPKYYGIENSPWEEIPASYLHDCTEENCVDGHYGADCSQICGKCPENGYCVDGVKGNGSCACKPGYYGVNCTDRCAADSHCGKNEICQNGQCICDTNFYGSSCATYCSRFGTCGGHGSCSESGVCLCDDSYSGFNCNIHDGNFTYTIEDKLPDGAQQGLTITHYSGEGFSISPEEWISPNLNLESFSNNYDSYIAKGSFCPNVTGKYKFKVEGKSYVTFVFNGIEYQPTKGLLGSCLPQIKETKETTDLVLNAHMCYPFEIRLITGCRIYSQFLRFFVAIQGKAWEIAKDLISIQHKECMPFYFNPTCSARVSIDCSSHGYPNDGMNGNGLCICDDGYLSPDCSKKPIIGEPKCPAGINLTVYDDEIWFTGDKAHITHDQFSLPSISNSYDALVFSSSIIPPQKGEYQFRMIAKPKGQIEFMGEKIPSQMGAAGSCNGLELDDYSTSITTLNPNTTYPIIINMRTGCPSITKSLSLQWKNGPKYYGIANAQWEEIPNQYIYSCKEKDCIKGIYGPQCETRCKQCPEHSSCRDGIAGNGECFCDPGYYGANCDLECETDLHCGNNQKCYNGKCVCKGGFYGDKCDILCTPQYNCSNHGFCNNDGSCRCNTPWGGINCSIRFPDFTPAKTETPARTIYIPSHDFSVEIGTMNSNQPPNSGNEANQGSVSNSAKTVFTTEIIILISAVGVCLFILVAILLCRKKKPQSDFLTSDLTQSMVQDDTFRDYWSDV